MGLRARQMAASLRVGGTPGPSHRAGMVVDTTFSGLVALVPDIIWRPVDNPPRGWMRGQGIRDRNSVGERNGTIHL